MRILNKKEIYLDYASATPIDKNILKKIELFNRKNFANPSAIYKNGVFVRNVLENSRKDIALLLNAQSDEIIFTGSGTESVALATLGLIFAKQKEDFLRSSPACQIRTGRDEGDGSGARPFEKSLSASRKLHVITTNIEHPAVLENCKILEERGLAEVTYVPVEENGIVDPKKIREALREDTILVSVIYANNEIGTVQPIREIAKEIRHFKKMKSAPQGLALDSLKARPFPTDFPIFHTDACQAMNYLDVSNMERLGVDMLSFNSSKIYGPKGVGVLYKKRGVHLSPIYGGGGQEFGLRSGTENTSLILGTALALSQTFKMKEKENTRLKELQKYLIEGIKNLSKESGYEILINGDLENRLPNNLNISIAGIRSELLVIELDAKGICVSEKSACGSKDSEPSHVIKALHQNPKGLSFGIDNSIRISMGRETNKKQIDIFLKSLLEILNKYKGFR